MRQVRRIFSYNRKMVPYFSLNMTTAKATTLKNGFGIINNLARNRIHLCFTLIFSWDSRNLELKHLGFDSIDSSQNYFTKSYYYKKRILIFFLAFNSSKVLRIKYHRVFGFRAIPAALLTKV